MKHKDNRPRSFFDEHFRLEKLSQQNDPLQNLNERIRWELFRPLLNEVFYKEAKGPGGCRPYDYVLMFKILILQRYYNIGDDKMEFAILDRLSFMRFLGLTLSDKVPDAKTIWLFREQLTKAGAIEKLFVLFNEYLNNEGLIADEGKMVDASFVEVPIQRNTRQENKDIKQGNVPEQWDENPHKLARKDTDARWTKKNGRSYYGYKNHIKADEKSKLIDAYTVTDASVHDSQETEPLLSEADKGQPLHADSAYSGEPVAQVVEQKEMINQSNYSANCSYNDPSVPTASGHLPLSRGEKICFFLFPSFTSPKGTTSWEGCPDTCFGVGTGWSYCIPILFAE